MKELLKRIFVPTLASRPVTTLAHKLFDYGAPVFMLHRMAEKGESDTGKISPEHLRNCLDYLVEHDYTFLSLEELVLTLKNNQKIPSKSVVFTIDDGYLDQAEIASSIFLEYNCPLTFFVITGMLDQVVWPWDAKVSWLIESSTDPTLDFRSTVKSLNLVFDNEINKRSIRRTIQDALKKTDASAIPGILQQLADETGVTIPDNPPPEYEPMTWDMARQLEQQGIRFAPHSVNHNILSRLSQESIEKEIKGAWETISSELKNPLKVFCYPNGRPIDFGDREIEVLKNNSYLGAVSTTPGFVRSKKCSDDQIYSLPRLALPDNMNDFIQYCSWIESAKESLLKPTN